MVIQLVYFITCCVRVRIDDSIQLGNILSFLKVLMSINFRSCLVSGKFEFSIILNKQYKITINYLVLIDVKDINIL